MWATDNQWPGYPPPQYGAPPQYGGAPPQQLWGVGAAPQLAQKRSWDIAMGSTGFAASSSAKRVQPGTVPNLEGMPLPRVVVIDLDEACWDRYLDNKPYVGPPFTWCPNRRTVQDRAGTAVNLYPQVPRVLLACHQAGIPVAVASHNTQSLWCSEVFDNYILCEASGLTWGDVMPEALRIISGDEEYWPQKDKHYKEICANVPGGACDIKDMLVFDTGKKAAKLVNAIGGVGIRCDGGLTITAFMEGITFGRDQWTNRGGGATGAVGIPAPIVKAAEFVLKGPVPIPDLSNFLLPRVAVFDLDQTSWDHWALDHKPFVGPPFQWDDSKDAVVDNGGTPVRLFPEFAQVVLALHRAGVQIAIASHNTKPTWCEGVVDNCYLDREEGITWGSLVPKELRVIKSEGLYWPRKAKHLKDICENFPGGACQMREMLFFDDGKKICKEATQMGAVGVHCERGVTIARMMEGIKILSNPGA